MAAAMAPSAPPGEHRGSSAPPVLRARTGAKTGMPAQPPYEPTTPYGAGSIYALPGTAASSSSGGPAVPAPGQPWGPGTEAYAKAYGLDETYAGRFSRRSTSAGPKHFVPASPGSPVPAKRMPVPKLTAAKAVKPSVAKPPPPAKPLMPCSVKLTAAVGKVSPIPLAPPMLNMPEVPPIIGELLEKQATAPDDLSGKDCDILEMFHEDRRKKQQELERWHLGAFVDAQREVQQLVIDSLDHPSDPQAVAVPTAPVLVAETAGLALRDHVPTLSVPNEIKAMTEHAVWVQAGPKAALR